MPGFHHDFDPISSAPVGPYADLTIREIEDAGLREVLQSSGAALGPWDVLAALLYPTTPEFRFREPLGHAREVKTALSGLFGRFVARAYANRYLGLSHFAHITKPPMRLAGVFSGELRRVRRRKGDMPDWVAWGPSRGMAIVEAKGSHDRGGPVATLARAYQQAERAEIRLGRRLAPFKRYAIATRWGFGPPTNWSPMLWVRDPDEEGDGLSSEEARELQAGIVRLHCANLLRRLQQDELVEALRRQVAIGVSSRRNAADQEALRVLEKATRKEIEWDRQVQPNDALVGGFVTANGTLPTDQLSVADQEVLKRLQLRPAFVGIEASMIKLAIVGDINGIERRRFTTLVAQPDEARIGPVDDGAGSWVVRLEEDAATVR